MKLGMEVIHYTGLRGTVDKLFENAIQFKATTGATFTGWKDEFLTREQLAAMVEKAK